MKTALPISFVLGFLTASPIGPIGLLCLRRTLTAGIATGLVSALGVSCAYGFWSFAAAHGLATASHWIEGERAMLEAAVGLFFLLYGLHGSFHPPSKSNQMPGRRGSIAEFLSTFLVVFLNPATFIMFSALFTIFGIAKSYFGLRESLEIAGSVFSGAITFWIVATQVVSTAKDRIHEEFFRLASRMFSYAIALFGMAILFYSAHDYLYL